MLLKINLKADRVNTLCIYEQRVTIPMRLNINPIKQICNANVYNWLSRKLLFFVQKPDIFYKSHCGCAAKLFSAAAMQMLGRLHFCSESLAYLP